MAEIPVYKQSSDGTVCNMTAPLPVTKTDSGEGPDCMIPGYGQNQPDTVPVIEADSGTGGSAPEGMQIFFHTGAHDIFFENFAGGRDSRKNPPPGSVSKVPCPPGFVDRIGDDRRFGERVLDESRMTLRLDSEHGLKPLYDSVSVDTSGEYTFKFIHRKKLDAKAIFVFNNKNFVCKQLQYTVGPDGTDPLATGIFYPVN